MTVTHGFELIEERNIPEINTLGRLYRHIKTGAQLLSLVNDDDNKVFGIAFATPPTDSTGLPHIMEHSVLCGSQKYPVKEPFIELAKGSLNTFLNAMTYPDRTIYPVASQNIKDLYNLIDVYLDATLYPRITRWTLMQEGWHYELEDKSQPLQFKGVVFNEMKGAYSSPESVLGRAVQHTLLPDTTYGVDSGGDPAAIPDLTYEQFKQFHDTYYHPSNALIVFYGNDDPAVRLRYMDSWLGRFDRIEVKPVMQLQPRWQEPRRVVERYDAGEEAQGKRGMVSVNWLLTEEVDPETTLSLQILSHMLVGTPASPLRKALIDSGLGENLTSSGIEDELRESFFSVGLKGIDPADAGKIERLVLDTLKHLAKHGFDQDQVEASVNTIEFRLRESNFGNFPRGIAFMTMALSTWLYGGDPFTPLEFEKPLQSIKDRLSKHEYVFANLIKQYFLDNPHRTLVILTPDAAVSAEMETKERARLDAARTAMSAADLDCIIEETKTLKEMQIAPDSPEALATIPSLKLSDLDRKIKTIPIEVQAGDGVDSSSQGEAVLYHDLFTNGIAYLDVAFDLRSLPAEDVAYAGLIGRALLQMGTDKEDFVKLLQRIGRKTGGITHSTLNTITREGREGVGRFMLRGKGTVEQFDDLLDILRDVLLTARLDNKERFKQIVLENKASYESGLVPSGHVYVNTRLKSAFSSADWASEQIGGISQLFFLRKLAEQVDQDWDGVLARLTAVRNALITRHGLVANITLDAKNWDKLQPKLTAFINHLPATNHQSSDWPEGGEAINEGLTIPAQVNYVGKGVDLYALGHQLNGSWFAVQNYLRTVYLWERVRVQGGAYGGFCTFDPRGGGFTYLSYRDPNLLGTLNNYDGAPSFLREHTPGEEEVTRTIIGVIGDLDDYMLPDAKGYTSMVRWLAKDTDDYRQRVRDQVLSTTPHDFVKFADVLEDVNRHGHIVVVGSPGAIEKANAEKGSDWLTVTKVL